MIYLSGYYGAFVVALQPMTIILREPSIAQGCFGKVFRKGDNAIKVFKRPPDINENDLDPVDIVGETQRRRQIFDSEVLAYRTALEIDDLRQYVSHFRGRVDISHIYDENNNDISGDFLLDCAYSMQYLCVDFIDANANIREVKDLFIANGIQHMDDCSFHLDERGNVAGVIDFAMQDYPQCV